MAMKKKGKAFANQNTTLSGLHIYKDKKGRNVYLNTFDKTGYLITEADEKDYRMYAMRFILGLIIFILLCSLEIHPLLSAFLGIAAYVILEVRFRKKFLAHLTQIPNFVPEAKESALAAASREERGRIIIKCFLYLAFSILMALNTYMQAEAGTASPIIQGIGYLFAMGGAGMCIFQCLALKNNLQTK